MTRDYEAMADWQLYERLEVAVFGFPGAAIEEVLRRYEPHADMERPPDAAAWCLDCEWETLVEPTWRDPDPVPRARKAAAGHIGNSDGCERYDYGRMQ